jgi:hypothetical protein
MRFRGGEQAVIMQSRNTIQAAAESRDAAFRKLNRLTAGVAVGALTGVAGLAVVSAETIPGNATATTSDTANPTSPSQTQAPTGFQPSSGVSSSSNPAHVVTGSS